MGNAKTVFTPGEAKDTQSLPRASGDSEQKPTGVVVAPAWCMESTAPSPLFKDNERRNKVEGSKRDSYYRTPFHCKNFRDFDIDQS